MARYIDADKLRKELIDRQITTQFFNPRERHEIGCIIDMLDNAPTADVVTKSEAESLTLELNAMRGAANSYKMHYNNLAKEIFEEVEKLFFKNGVFIHIQSYNQLKKKYTEEGEKS